MPVVHVRARFGWSLPHVQAAAGSAVIGVAPAVGVAAGVIEGDGLAAGAVVGGIGLLVAALALFAARGGPRRVEVGDAALRWVDERGGEHAAGWDEVRGVFLRRDRDDRGDVTVDTVRVVFEGGLALVADGRLSHYAKLRTEVERRATEAALVRKRAELADTGSAWFGPVTVGGDGVTVRGTFVAWDEVERWQVSDDAVSVHTPHGLKVAPAAEVPDAGALARLLGEFAGATAGA